MALHVDDCYAVGHPKALEDAIKQISKHFKLKVEDVLTDYLSCEIRFNKLKTKAWVGQPHLIKRLEQKFGAMIKTTQTY